MLIDLHSHTRPLSWDSDLTPDDLIELTKRAGLDGICLSEHDAFWEPERVAELGRKHNFLVLPGVEINTEAGHVLCFGVDRYAYGMHRWPELAEHVRLAGGVMVAAHPYRRQMPWNQAKVEDYEAALNRAGANPLYPACAALEGLNGRGTEAENAFSAQIVERLAMPATAGSDAHAVPDIGRCATEFSDRIEGLAELIEALRAGRCRPVRLDARAHPLQPLTA
jgi:predicted metal-dependent phosphoesterase TrpH